MTHIAQDTFVAELDGAQLRVTRGEAFPDGHPLVKLDGGKGVLFKPMDLGEGAPVKRAAAKEKEKP